MITVTTGYHRSVMVDECIEALCIHPEGVYVDATFGGGGHSLAILSRLKGGRLIAFDRDRSAAQKAARIAHRSFSFHQANFAHMKRYLRLEGVEKVNGILADLGVSSHQIDTPERGFSTRYNGPLDMRMDRGSKRTAADVVNAYSEERLYTLFRRYGELPNARAVVRKIAEARRKNDITHTSALVEAVRPLAPRNREYRYYARVFQALRMEVNREIDALERFLRQCAETLETKGRLAALSYHSLEDRMVKRFMRYGNADDEPQKDMYGRVYRPFQALSRRPVAASEKEIAENNRARSAKLRWAERI